MLFSRYVRARKYHKTLSCNFFGVHVSLVHILTLLFTSAPRQHRRRRRRRRSANKPPALSSVKLSHHIWSEGEWRKARFLDHPILQVTKSDNLASGRPCPTTNPAIITAIAHTGAQSCLWWMPGFVVAGLSAEYLLPVSVNLTATNKTRIVITGGVVLRLRASSSANDRQSCAAMLYVSSAAHGFYLSCEVMADLGLVPVDFSSIRRYRPFQLLHHPPTYLLAPTINRTLDSVPVTLGACRPSLITTDLAHTLHAL